MASTIDTNRSYAIQGQMLQDICDAVKAKTGDSSMPVADLPKKIISIPTADPEYIPKDIIFIDYDGSVIEEYDLAEYLQKSAVTSQGYNTYYVPTPPTHNGLTFDGWNFPSDTEIGNYVNTIGCAVIGALYKTADDKFKIYLNIKDPNELDLTLTYYKMSSTTSLTIDWGDGSTMGDASASGSKGRTHTYAQAGEYVLSVATNNTAMTNQFRLGASSVPVLSRTTREHQSYAYASGLKCVTKVELPSWIGGLYGVCFMRMPNLRSITIPKNLGTTTSVFPITAQANIFMGCSSLTGFVYPPVSSTLSMGTSTFFGCVSLKYVSVPYSSTIVFAGLFSQSTIRCIYICAGTTTATGITLANMNDYIKRFVFGLVNNTTITLSYAYYSPLLKEIDLSTVTCTTIPSSFTAYDSYLITIKLPKGITTINASAFANCGSLKELDFSKGNVSSIAASAFSSCFLCIKYDFTGNTAVPTLANTNAFTGINPNTKIVVPDNLVTTWKAASNWSTYASYIIGESDYNA